MISFKTNGKRIEQMFFFNLIRTKKEKRYLRSFVWKQTKKKVYKETKEIKKNKQRNKTNKQRNKQKQRKKPQKTKVNEETKNDTNKMSKDIFDNFYTLD